MNVLPNIPSLFEGEALLGWIRVAVALNSHRRPGDVLNELLGKSGSAQRGIQRLVEVAPSLGAPTTLLIDHTCTGFELSVVGPEVHAAKVARGLRDLPLLSKSMPRVKRCRACVESDLYRFGRARLLVEHQLTVSLACIHHGAILDVATEPGALLFEGDDRAWSPCLPPSDARFSRYMALAKIASRLREFGRSPLSVGTTLETISRELAGKAVNALQCDSPKPESAASWKALETRLRRANLLPRLAELGVPQEMSLTRLMIRRGPMLAASGVAIAIELAFQTWDAFWSAYASRRDLA